MASRNKDRADWIAAYKDVNAKRALLPSGEGWGKFEELKIQLKVGDCKLRSLIKTLQNEKKIEVYVGSEPDVTGALKKRVWYRLK